MTNKAVRFLVANFLLPRATPGVLIDAIEEGGKVSIVLKLTEDTTSKQIKDSIPLVLKWRDRLMEWQGIWLHGGNNLFLIKLDEYHKGGRSYAELAEKINARIAEYLRQHFEFEREYQAALPKFKTWGDYLDWLHAEDDAEDDPRDNPKRLEKAFALDHARNLLEGIRYQDDVKAEGRKKKGKRPNKERPKDIDAILAEGLKRIAEGKPPFDEDYPVDAERVKATLKSWRGSKKHKILKAKEREWEQERERERANPRKN